MRRRNEALAHRIRILAARHVHVSDKQIADVAGVDAKVVANLRRRLKIKGLRLIIGEKESKRRYHAAHLEKQRVWKANQLIKYRLLVLGHYGFVCTHLDASPSNCSTQLHIHHVNHDGNLHRLALGKNRECGSLTMYRFIWKVITKGPQVDRLGKKWVESDFATMCSTHNVKEQ